MGVPQFFRFVQRKYPKIVQRVENCDNLYLDMNGIIHPCTHPEGGVQPTNEEEMFNNIFKYIDHIIELVRPTVIFMAIDGPAPSAKQAQQRSRRFRSALENEPGAWDSNQITPGTSFMFNLTNALKMYVHDRLNSHPLWTKSVVILSDASVEGEGEHKICNFVRSLRIDSNYNPNTKHCILGLDADLIMLGLATHEPNFYVMREDVLLLERQKRQAVDSGADRVVQNDHPPYIMISIPILREYLEIELNPNHPQWELERAFDDWVFLCFFVGNDFLPHLPSLEIREGAINLLVDLYKTHFKNTLHLVDKGKVLLKKVEILIKYLGEAEDLIFRKRKNQENDREQRNARQSEEQKTRELGKRINNSISLADMGSMSNSEVIQNRGELRISNNKVAEQMRLDLANKLKRKSTEAHEKTKKAKIEGHDAIIVKHTEVVAEIEVVEQVDNVKFHEEGWRRRYYIEKFKIDILDPKDKHKHEQITFNYIQGLCWVFEYYYLGCPSWQYVYRYHYAPFASDFSNIGSLSIEFEIGTPYKPLEQLMRVLPSQSIDFIPKPWHYLMTSDKSSIIDYYPLEFPIDLNGKKHSWQGVVLLPFIEDKRMKEVLDEDLLDTRDLLLNSFGKDLIYISDKNDAYNTCCGLYNREMIVDSSILPVHGKLGILKHESIPGSLLNYPASGLDLQIVENSGCLGLKFEMTKSRLVPFGMLKGARLPRRQLGTWDIDKIKNPRSNNRYPRHILVEEHREEARLSNQSGYNNFANDRRGQGNYSLFNKNK
eukprot:NODE_502_length_7546_cov_0.138982.p1 type:complete len:771 gc:universal NODE_502_length_7546_cov_0.138982:6364-4052(-)